MFGSVKKIISAFETRRQARPPSVPSPLPSSLNSSVSSSSPSQSLGSPSSPSSSSSSSSVLSKASSLHSPVSQDSRPYTLRASSPGKPCPDSASSSPSAKRLARLSVPPGAEPILSSLQTASPLHLSRSPESAVLRERRCRDGEGKGRAGRDVPRMRVRDSWPIGQQRCVERWNRYTQTVPLRTDRHTQTFSTSAGPRSSSATRLKSTSASGSTACSVGAKTSSGAPALATAATGQSICSKGSISISTASPKVLIVNSNEGLPVSSSPGPSTTGPTVSCTTGPHFTSTTGPIVNSSTEPTVNFTIRPHVTSATGPIVTSSTRPTISLTTGPHVNPSTQSMADPGTGWSSSPVIKPYSNSTTTALGSVTGPNVCTTVKPTDTSSVSTTDRPAVGSNIHPCTISRPDGVSSIITDSAVCFATGHDAIPTLGSVVNSTTGPTTQAHSNRSTAVGSSLSASHQSPGAEAPAPAAPPLGGPYPSCPLKGPSILGNPQAFTPCDPQENHTAMSDSRAQPVGKPVSGWDSGSNAGLVQSHIALQRVADQQGSSSSPLSLQSCCPSQGALSRPLRPALAPGRGCVEDTKRRGPQGGLALLPVAKQKLDLKKEAWCRSSEAAFLSLVLFCRG